MLSSLYSFSGYAAANLSNLANISGDATFLTEASILPVILRACESVIPPDNNSAWNTSCPTVLLLALSMLTCILNFPPILSNAPESELPVAFTKSVSLSCTMNSTFLSTDLTDLLALSTCLRIFVFCFSVFLAFTVGLASTFGAASTVGAGSVLVSKSYPILNVFNPSGVFTTETKSDSGVYSLISKLSSVLTLGFIDPS